MAGIPFVIDLSSINSLNGFKIYGTTLNEHAGSSVASAGDVNGDGLADIIVGAPGVPLSAYGSTDYAAYVVFGSGAEDSPRPSSIDSNYLESDEGFRIVLSGSVEGGFAVSSAGDFNGDGFGDFVVSAPSFGVDDKGATFIVFGKADGFTDVSLGTTTSRDWIRIDGAAAGDRSGNSVASLGDINGDGFGDVLIGAPYADGNGRWSSGISYVVYGNASGTNLDLANFDASQGFRIIGNFTAGYSVSAAGDVNGDGITDLLIGAPENAVGGVYSSGSTYLVYGNNSGADVDLANLTPSQGIRIDGVARSESGFSVASAGDINGDGLADLIIGAPDESPNGREQAGAAYVIFGQTGGLSNINLANLAPSDGFRIIGAATEDNTGYSVSSAGDFNGDGFADIIVGAPNADPDGRTNTGSAYVIFGKASGFGDIDLASLSATDGFQIAGPAGQVYFGLGNLTGFSVASAGDVNGDGYSDLLVGVPGFYSPGTAYVIYGEPSSAVNKVGTANADRLFGGDFNDTLSGGDGNDLLGGGEGDDLLTGGAGSDSFVYARFGEQYDKVTDFQQGLDVIDVAAANIDSFATVQKLLSNDAQGNAVITTVFDGLTSTMTVTGISAERLTAADFVFAGDDSYPPVGTDNADDLFGGGGSNSLLGKAGDDRLFGEQGRDTLEGGAGADLLDGGEGIDEVDYRTAQAGVDASLASGGTAGDAAGDRYVSIENMVGSEFDDVLEGDDQANTILALSGNNVVRGLGGDDHLFGGNESDTFYGGAGADEMDGAGGFDYARYDDAPSGVTVALGAGSGDAAGDRLLNIEGIVGSAFADTLGGGSGNNDLQGGAGDDVLMGRWGDDTLDGGNGSDSAVFSGARGSYQVSFDAATQTYFIDDLREGSPDGTDHVRNVEAFVFADGAVPAASVLDGNPITTSIGDDGDNTLTGTALANEIHGVGGNDTLAGLAGEDMLDGGDGDDMLDGGTGVDTASYASAGSGVTVSLAVAGPQSTDGAGVDTLVSIENLAGSAFEDQLTGDAVANVISGLDGNARLEGGAGNDTLLGGTGDDILIGGAGADALDGGPGFDLVSYETSTTVVPILYLMPIDLSGSGGIGDAAGDTYANIEGVIGSNNNDVITGRIGVDDTLIGAGGNDILLGQGGKDTLIGGVGNDLLIAVSGNTRFEGGDGIDTVSYSHGTLDINSGITADLDNPSRNTGIAAGHTYDGIDNLLGSILNDSLVGNDRVNVIMGGLGDDVLIGGDGADVLNGNLFFNADITNWYEGTPIGAGDGFDIASYETAMSGVVVSLTNPANNTGDAAGDTFILIEGLAGSAFDDTLVGDQNHNTLVGGAGNDTLIGIGEGDDYNGGAGNDTVVLDGRRGDYTITYDAGS